MTDDEAQHLQQLHTDYGTCFKTDAGRRVLDDLIRNFRVFLPCHREGDPFQTTYNDGARTTVLYILEKVMPITDEIRTNAAALEQRRKEWRAKYDQEPPF